MRSKSYVGLLMAPLKKKNSNRNSGPVSDAAIKAPTNTGKLKAASLQFNDMPDFPRGGRSFLSINEKDEVRDEVDPEFESEGRGFQKKRKRDKAVDLKKGNKLSADDELGSLFGDGLTGKLPKFANMITLKNISAGMKLLGVIAEVNEKDLEVSLPGGLCGLVRASEAIDAAFIDIIMKDGENIFLSSMFQVGQLVPCVVLQVEGDKNETCKRKVWLSLRLSLLHKGLSFDAIQEGTVLSAHVKSIEDHGYLLHFGVSSFTGFLPKKSQDGNGEIKVNCGQILQGVVKSIDNVRRVVHLCCDADIVAKCVTMDHMGISLDLLVPGMMVNARVQATLENGVMLSFLTYFTGTVDNFHLTEMLPSSDWKKKYETKTKVNARVLFIDPSTRAVGLTMNPYLILNKAPPLAVNIGDVYDKAKIIRIDKGFGLLLEIPTAPVSTPGFVYTGDVADGEVTRLDKKFKEGSHVRARILGFRHLEGLAMGVLKASAFESALVTHSDVKPGMVVKAKVVTVNTSGAIVQFRSGVKALCPLQHMSEFERAKPRKKFKVGAELLYRVLGCKSKRITVTHKKTLVKSKLFVLASYADATDGLITHGWISKIEKHGCFVKFYNGVQGFAPRAELGLEAGHDTSSIYHVGQVVKCRVTSTVPAHHRINLSFITSSRVSVSEMVKLGSLVSGVVEDVTPRAVLLHIKSEGNIKGTIYNEHLADHQSNAALMKSVLKAGHDLSELLVLDIEGNNLILSAKYSLSHARDQLPFNVVQMHPKSVIQGYICNLIETGCFVRFLGHLTAFSPRRKAVDDQTIDLSEAFYIGQSVRSYILDVNSETGRIMVSLKQSSCCSIDASFIQSYFLTKKKIVEFQASDSSGSEMTWIENFSIGNAVDCMIHEIKDFGVTVNFDKYTDVVGFVSQFQLGGRTVKIGSTVQAVVLDVSKEERLVDLSLKPEFVKSSNEPSGSSASKKKRKRDTGKEVKENTSVNAVVEIVKHDYLVLSLPEHNNAIGFAAVTDYNTQKLSQKQFLNGESVNATIVALPSSPTDGRLLLLLDSVKHATETFSSKRAKKKSSYDIGSLVQAEITEVKLLELNVKFGPGFRGRIFATELNDGNGVENPLASYKIGQTLTARIIGNPAHSRSRKGHLWELSMKPSILSGSAAVLDKLMAEEFNFSVGQLVSGYISKVDKDWIWLMVSHQVKAQIFILDTAKEPKDLKWFHKTFKTGDELSGYIMNVNKDKKLLRLSLCQHSDEREYLERNLYNVSIEKGACHIHKGATIAGRIWKILPGIGGMLVQIGPHLYGKVHYTEIEDDWVSEPLTGYEEGQFVKCKVLEIGQSVTGNVLVDLSLRSFSDSVECKRTSKPGLKWISLSYHPEMIEDLHPNMVIQGYVKNVTPKGCFIMLSRNIDAKVLLSHLSDGFVKDPQKEFPVGALVTGKVLSVDAASKRVEMTLKSSSESDKTKSRINDLTHLDVGDVVYGTIRRAESFGLFITIDNSNIVGLCHISEVADDYIDSIENKYRAGEAVTAKVLKVDTDRQRISLGMKPSYFSDGVTSLPNLTSGSDGANQGNGSIDNIRNLSHLDNDMLSLSDSDDELELKSSDIVPGDFVPPLDVNLDEVSQVDEDGVNEPVQDVKGGADTTMDEKARRERKWAREESEQKIRVAEERLREGGRPKTTNEYEMLVRSSPNSSFVWINYMAFMLSSADVEGARAVAERALKTINMTYEVEKLNVWIAYLNLENKYGNPTEEAVKRIFDRALQLCDPLKLHLKLLELYENTKQDKLAGEVLEKMLKKFKDTPEVWLRRIEWLLKQKRDGVEITMIRALMSIPRHKKAHINFCTQVALLEYDYGCPEKGRSLFEKILRENPKRTDLWSVYLDKEKKLKSPPDLRALFERATSLSLPLTKMKFLFKKYEEYEKSLGDKERAGYVVQKAREYCDSFV